MTPSDTSGKLSRYLKEVYLAQMFQAFMKCHVKRTDVQLAKGATPVNTREAKAQREIQT